MPVADRIPRYFYPIAVVALIWFIGMISLEYSSWRYTEFEFQKRLLVRLSDLDNIANWFYQIGIWAGLVGAWLLMRRSILAPLAWAVAFLGFFGFVLQVWVQDKVFLFQWQETCFVCTSLSLTFLLYLYARAVKTRLHLI